MTTVVSFRSGGQDWAVPLERVQRVLGARGLLPLPDPRPGVAGPLHRDGHTVTVVSPTGGGRAPRRPAVAAGAGVLPGARPLLLLDVASLTGWLAP